MSFLDKNLDSLFLSKTYFNNIIFYEINLNNPELLNDIIFDKLYIVRIWIRWSNNYVYKIGTTKNIKRRIRELNYEYDCYGRIIIVAVGQICSTAIEKKFHNKLKEYRINNITNPIKSNKKELYNINNKLYDNFIDLFKIYSDNYLFESEYYVLDDDNMEHILSYNIYKKYFSNNMNRKIEKNDNFISLNKESIELEYWSFVTKYY